MLSWRGRTPYSTQYQDVYFSRSGGLAETQHVFLEGNGLPERWLDRQSFTIAETGLGTGTNLWATLHAWQAHPPAGSSSLSFLSVEQDPLSREEMLEALTLIPELLPTAQPWLEDYPERPVQGERWEHIRGAVRVAVDFREASEALRAWEQEQVDAWMLDGFSPAKNPQMWTPELMREVFRLTLPGGTLSTYTVAGTVRRALQTAGFQLRKAPGFGQKREMLMGHKPSLPVESVTLPDIP